MSNAIETSALRKEFPGVVAVDSLTFAVPEGEIFGLVGPDGAGKTTTMRMLAAIMDPTGGDARVAGLSVRKDGDAVKNHIGYMSQRFGLYPDLTVIENLDFYADIYGIPARGRAEKIDALLSFSGLLHFKKRQAGRLSGGMKQKLGLACALVHTPKVLLLDEPTNGVDPVSRRDFWRILYRLLSEKVTILVSTAYLDEAERCNAIGLMHNGRMIATGDPGEVKKLMRGSLIVISTDDPRRGASVLKRALPEDGVGILGGAVHVTTNDFARTMREAPRILRESGIAILEIKEEEPSLEDVFVSMMAES
ncbi:MAG: ABC transporter ATP-binding protein [bacterium]|jgi:ABC-2 type transport system ATP-binding protein